jgi:membrane-associated phospholipid phosphatase
MIRKFFLFVLRCRLENVMAVVVPYALLVFFLTTRLFHSFEFGMLDFIFILLPIGILGVKCLLELLAAPELEDGQNFDAMNYLASFFRPLVGIFRDWFPFFLLGACYYSLYSNLMLKVNPHTADAALSKIDAALLGNQASFLLEPFVRPALTDFFNVIYFSHVIFFPGVALYFYLAKERKVFRRLMMGYLTIMLMGVVSYLLIPAVGPEKYFANQYTHDLRGQLLSRSVDYIINIGRVAYDCFPSLHVGIPLLLSFYLRDYCRKAFIPALVYVALMCCATIYLRYHYFIDVVAAFAYAPAAYYLNDFLLARWPGEKLSGLAAEIEEKRHPDHPAQSQCVNQPEI